VNICGFDRTSVNRGCHGIWAPNCDTAHSVQNIQLFKEVVENSIPFAPSNLAD
jgi:hypothetical protein